MFGRKNDDYDEYNEKYAAKYDDDYIAPSHEYRSECDHSHEQSYANINDVRECDHSHEQSYANINDVRECGHSHEQTYEDSDYEQHPYDDYASLESRFQPFLAPGEHLLWVGGHDKKSPKPPTERKKDKKALTILIIISAVLIVSGFVTGALCMLSFIGFIMLFFVLLGAAGAFNQGVYAITDMRLINIRNNSPVFVPLADISNISAVTGNNNTGYVTFSTRHPVRTGQQAQNGIYKSVINGINDPQRVKRILQDAVHGARINGQRK